MRRKALKSIACAAAITLALSVTACGGSDDSANNNTTVVEDTVDKAEDESAKEPEEVNEAEEEDVVKDESDTNEEAASEEATGTEEDNAENEDTFASLEEAFSEPEVKAAIDEQMNSFEMEGMEISYEVSGNDFIVIYKITSTTIDDPDDFAAQMEPVMDQLGVAFSPIAEVFDELFEQKGATTVVVRYLDASDTTLIERSYKAE